MNEQIKPLYHEAYWLSQQRQSLWALASLAVIVMVGLLGYYPDVLEFGRSQVFMDDFATFWTHWMFPFFFFLVSLEARREMQSEHGELKGRRAIAPMMMAFGGVIMPWLIFSLITKNPSPHHGSLIPVATDIAFVVLGMTLGQVSHKLRVALLALAIADDVAGILLMAVFFNAWGIAQFAVVIGLLFMVWFMQKIDFFLDRFWIARQAFFWVIVCLVVVWLLNEVHLHPSLGGVITALMVPFKPGELRIKKSGHARDSVYHVLEDSGLNVPVNWLIVPGFIMLSVVIKSENLQGTWANKDFLGIFLGFVVGKTIGVYSAGLLARRLVGVFPARSKLELFFGSILCGMGLTVALFFTGLSNDINHTAATVGILAASLFCGIVGIFGLRLCNRKQSNKSSGQKINKVSPY